MIQFNSNSIQLFYLTFFHNLVIVVDDTVGLVQVLLFY